MSLVPLPDGDLLVAAADPWLGRLRPDGTPAWAQGPPKADFRNQRYTLAVSGDGTRIGFDFAPFGKQPARFDLTARALALDPPTERDMAAPRQDGLPIEHWVNEDHPTLGGRPLALERVRDLPQPRHPPSREIASCWGRSGPCAPSRPTARPCGPGRFPARFGR